MKLGSKRKKETSNVKCRWFLADEARTESSGKVMLIGLYPDDQLILEMPSDAPGPTVEAPLYVEGVTIVCYLSGFQGKEEFELTRSRISLAKF